MLQAAAETAQQRHDLPEEASQFVMSGLRRAGQTSAWRKSGQRSAWRKRGQSDLADTVVRSQLQQRSPAAGSTDLLRDSLPSESNIKSSQESCEVASGGPCAPRCGSLAAPHTMAVSITALQQSLCIALSCIAQASSRTASKPNLFCCFVSARVARPHAAVIVDRKYAVSVNTRQLSRLEIGL